MTIMGKDPDRIPRFGEYPEPPEKPEEGPRVCAATEALRAMAKALGIRYTCGLVCGDHRVNEDNVTTLYRQMGGPSHSVTFEEDADGALWVADEVSPRQAVALAMVDDGARE